MMKMAAGERFVDGIILGGEMALDGVRRADFWRKSVHLLQRAASWAFLGPEKGAGGPKGDDFRPEPRPD